MARGDAAILLRFPHKGYREKIWDHAAGVVIVQEAGAVITDASGSHDLTIHQFVYCEKVQCRLAAICLGHCCCCDVQRSARYVRIYYPIVKFHDIAI